MNKPKKRKLRYLLLAVIAVIVLVAPIPVDNTRWDQTSYGIDTVRSIKDLIPYRARGNLQISYAEEDISTEVGQPLMGYTDRKSLKSEGISTPCYVRALTVKAATVDVTIVSVDMMILFDQLTDEIVKRSGLKREQLYFNATHTHSGPGGWAEGNILEFFYGKYKKEYFERIVSQAVKAIIISRQNMRPAEVGFITADAPEWVENRIYNDRPAWPPVSALVFRTPGSDKILAALTSYSAHGTVVRRETMKCSADYAGELCDAFSAGSGAKFVMYLSGAMGDARPRAGGEDGAKKMGEALSSKLESVLKGGKVEFRENIELCSEFLKVKVPRSRFALGSDWQLFPLFMRNFQPTETYLSVLRIGDNVLAGWPADAAGELARPLFEWGREFELAGKAHPVNILLTSFNGSWRGYFTTSDTFMSRDNYATRMMGFMGPWAGEYFSSLTRDLISLSYSTASK